MLFTTLVVTTVLCLLIPMTRVYAVIGAGLLLYFYTSLTLTLIGVLIILPGLVLFTRFLKRYPLDRQEPSNE